MRNICEESHLYVAESLFELHVGPEFHRDEDQTEYHDDKSQCQEHVYDYGIN